MTRLLPGLGLALALLAAAPAAAIDNPVLSVADQFRTTLVSPFRRLTVAGADGGVSGLGATTPCL